MDEAVFCPAMLRLENVIQGFLLIPNAAVREMMMEYSY
jgi:hypothetical protein